jgi:hypothetical protein
MGLWGLLTVAILCFRSRSNDAQTGFSYRVAAESALRVRPWPARRDRIEVDPSINQPDGGIRPIILTCPRAVRVHEAGIRKGRPTPMYLLQHRSRLTAYNGLYARSR